MTGIAKTAAAASMVALTMVRRDMSLISCAKFPTVLDDFRGFQVPAQQVKSSVRARVEPSTFGSHSGSCEIARGWVYAACVASATWGTTTTVRSLRRGRGRRLRWHDDAWRKRNVLYGLHAVDPIPRVAEA